MMTGYIAAHPRLRRIIALIVKETRQVLRDPSSIAIGVSAMK